MHFHLHWTFVRKGWMKWFFIIDICTSAHPPPSISPLSTPDGFGTWKKRKKTDEWSQRRDNWNAFMPPSVIHLCCAPAHVYCIWPHLPLVSDDALKKEESRCCEWTQTHSVSLERRSGWNSLEEHGKYHWSAPHGASSDNMHSVQVTWPGPQGEGCCLCKCMRSFIVLMLIWVSPELVLEKCWLYCTGCTTQFTPTPTHSFPDKLSRY